LRLKIVLGVLLALGIAEAGHGQTWRRLGPEGGIVQSLEAGAANEIYLGTDDGHVFASEDGARSWELRGRIGARIDGVVTRILIDPGRANRLFASIWYQAPGAGGGVFESDDAGETWRLLGLADQAVRALEVAGSQAQQLVAGTRTGVFRSSDQGKIWKRISPEGDEEIRNLDSLAIDPRDPQVMYAGTYHLPWLTRDGGKNWKPAIAGIIDDSDIMSLRLDATNPDRVYMSACSGIYRSENQGTQWTKLQGIPYEARRTQVIVQDAANPKTLYAGTTEGLWVTRDGGESWTRTTSKDWVVNSVVVLGSKGGQPGRVVLGTEQGIEVSDDAGMTFSEANQGFTHVIVRQLLADPANRDHLLTMVQRGAPEILESLDDGANWTKASLVAQEHGRLATVNADEVQQILASAWGWALQLQNGQMWTWEESKKSWIEWKLRFVGMAAQKGKVTGTRGVQTEVARPIVADGRVVFSRGAAVVASKEGLLSCQKSGNCARLKAYERSGKARAVWVSGAANEIAVVADQKLGWSSDGGETAVWRDLPVGQEEIAWVDATPSGGSERVFLGTGNGLYISAGPGAPWKRAGGGLPAGQIGEWLSSERVLVVNERDGGIYVSRNNGDSWSRADQVGETSRLTGIVETKTGGILMGSQSEGLLLLQPGQERKQRAQ
jgi:photosystem II stability/assembly factor-like uncharacterized protein